MKPSAGQTLNASQLCGAGVADMAGTATAVAAGTLTDTTLSQFVSGLAGRWVIMGGMRALILSATATVLTLDQWQNPGSSDAVAGPPTLGAYFIPAGAAPTRYGAISPNTSAPSSGDTSLPSEITTAGGGLVRQRATIAYTPGASSYTMTITWTANGTDTLPVVIDEAGWFQSAKGATGQPEFLEQLPSTAGLNVSGDQLTLTNTISM